MSQKRFWIWMILWALIYMTLLNFLPQMSEFAVTQFGQDLETLPIIAKVGVYTAFNTIIDLIVALMVALVAFRRLGQIDHSRLWSIFVFFTLFGGLTLGLNNLPPLGFKFSLGEGWPLIPALGFLTYLGFRTNSQRVDLSGPVPAFSRLLTIILGIVMTLLSVHVIVSALSAIPPLRESVSSIGAVFEPLINVIDGAADTTGLGGTNFRYLLSALFLGAFALLWNYERRNYREPKNETS